MEEKPVGIDFDARSKKWRVRLTREGRVYHLGYFKDLDAAIAARKTAEEAYDAGGEFKYIHSYITSSTKNNTDGDAALIDSGSVKIYDDPSRDIRVAVLIQAVRDLMTDREGQIYIDAHEWLQSDRRTHGFSFIEIAEVLDVDAELIRQAILKAVSDPENALRLIGRRLVRTNSGGVDMAT